VDWKTSVLLRRSNSKLELHVVSYFFGYSIFGSRTSFHRVAFAEKMIGRCKNFSIQVLLEPQRTNNPIRCNVNVMRTRCHQELLMQDLNWCMSQGQQARCSLSLMGVTLPISRIFDFPFRVCTSPDQVIVLELPYGVKMVDGIDDRRCQFTPRIVS
jgi:hypothetical protein